MGLEWLNSVLIEGMPRYSTPIEELQVLVGDFLFRLHFSLEGDLFALPVNLILIMIIKSRRLVSFDTDRVRLIVWVGAIAIASTVGLLEYQRQTAHYPEYASPMEIILGPPLFIYLCCLLFTAGFVKRSVPTNEVLVKLSIVLIPFFLIAIFLDIFLTLAGKYNDRLDPRGSIATSAFVLFISRVLLYTFIAWLFQKPWRKWLCKSKPAPDVP